MSVFNEKFIAVEKKIDSWEEAITFSGNLLLNEGKILPRYIDAMIENVNKLGPYILIAPNIALPHARPDSGVLEEGISVLVLKQPVYIGGAEDKPALLIICLAAKDAHSHIDLLKTISSWLSDESLVNQMLEVETKDELNEIVRKYYI